MSLSNQPDDATRAETAPEEAAAPPSAASGGLRGLIFFLALALVAGLFTAVYLRNPPRPRHTILAAVSLTPLNKGGQPLTLAELKGKVVLLNFWGTWCPHCVKELPDLIAVKEQFKDHPDFRLLAVSCGANEQDDQQIAKLRKTTQAFLDQRQMHLPTYFDPDSTTRQAVTDAISGGWRGYPTTLLLDRKQRIRGVWFGARKREEFAEAVGKVLKERS